MKQYIVAKTKNARDGKSYQILSWDSDDNVYVVHFKDFYSFSVAVEVADALIKPRYQKLTW